MDDEANVTTDTHGLKIRVLGLVDPVELQCRMRRVKLEIEDGRFRGLLLVGVELGKAGAEGVGDAEVHESEGMVRFMN